MPSLPRAEQIHLSPARLQRSVVFAANSKQHKFGDVSKVKAYAAPIGASILPNLVPN
jgi:hypothetical protein